MNRKRSHDDLEDADECLPISKRINSLHLEGKAQGICQSRNEEESRMLNGSFHASIINSSHAVNEGSVPFLQHEAVRHMGAAKFSQHDHRLSVHQEHDIASGSSMTMPVSHFHPSQSFYASPNLTTNVNGVHSENQSFPCDNHSRLEHHGISGPIYSMQVPFVNEQMHVSQSCGINDHFTNIISCPTAFTDFSHIHHENLSIDNDNCLEELPHGPYEPELGVKENPHYYTTNKLLYEAHLSRLQRIVPDYQLHS